MARVRIDDLPVAETLTPEQEELIQGAGLKSFRPTLEAPEDRLMMAGDITFAAATGVVTIQGDGIANRATVMQYQGDPQRGENGLQVEVKIDFLTKRFDAAQLKSIEFHGAAGDDSFTNYTEGQFAIQSRAYGGSGDDVLRGGSVTDVFYGEDGNDILYGGEGSDRLYGGAGDDQLYGGLGGDLLNGGTGNNTYDAGALDGRRVLYVNFDGADISHDDLVKWAGKDWSATDLDKKKDGIKVQAFLAGEANREEVINQAIWRIHADSRDLDVDLQRHTGLAVEGRKATTLFIGNATIDGLPGLRGIASDVDVGNDNTTDVGFVVQTWTGTDGEVAQFAANTAAHEAGHTFGLKHVDNAGLNDLMRVGGLATNAQNARNDYTFLDRSLDLAEWRDKVVHTTDAEGNRIQQNSYRTLAANLGLASPVSSGSLGVAVSAADRTSGDPAEFGGCDCPLCQQSALRAEAAPQAVAAPASFPAAEKAVPARAESSSLLALGEVQGAASPGIAKDRATALTDEVFAGGFDSGELYALTRELTSLGHHNRSQSEGDNYD
jgi:hypothetical protein